MVKEVVFATRSWRCFWSAMASASDSLPNVAYNFPASSRHVWSLLQRFFKNVICLSISTMSTPGCRLLNSASSFLILFFAKKKTKNGIPKRREIKSPRVRIASSSSLVMPITINAAIHETKITNPGV